MTNTASKLVILDLGRASKATHGDTHPWPWSENAAPPFTHFCPSC
jgi:hypothetical protein